MKRHVVILDDLKLDKDWWAHTKLGLVFGGMAITIFAIYAFVL